MIFLDTSVIVPILRKQGDVASLLEVLGDKQIGLTAPTAFELFYGAFISNKQVQNLTAVKRVVKAFPIFPLTFRSAIFAVKITRDLRRMGTMIEIMDIFIASIDRKSVV